MGLGSIAVSVLGSAVPGVPGDMGWVVEWGPSPIAPRQWESLGLEVLMRHPRAWPAPLVCFGHKHGLQEFGCWW